MILGIVSRDRAYDLRTVECSAVRDGRSNVAHLKWRASKHGLADCIIDRVADYPRVTLVAGLPCRVRNQAGALHTAFSRRIQVDSRRRSKAKHPRIARHCLGAEFLSQMIE